MKLYFPVPPQADGVLLRNFLRRCAVSTELARAVKFHGSGFFADGRPILANRRLAAGQMLSFELPADGEGVAPQPEIPVQVVHEDAFALLLEKPPRLAVHPTLNYPLDTLANGYAAWAAAQGRSTVFRPVNRIDKDTSGLVLAARNSYAAPLLAQGVEKLYYAIVEGELPLGPGVIDAPIGRQALHCAKQTYTIPAYTPMPDGIVIDWEAPQQRITVESPLPADLQALLTD